MDVRSMWQSTEYCCLEAGPGEDQYPERNLFQSGYLESSAMLKEWPEAQSTPQAIRLEAGIHVITHHLPRIHFREKTNQCTKCSWLSLESIIDELHDQEFFLGNLALLAINGDRSCLVK